MDSGLRVVGCILNLCGRKGQTECVRIAETAEAGEISHGKKLSLQNSRSVAANTDERQKTCPIALPKGFKIMQLSALIQAE
jgi:hypothetical protein